MRGNGNGKTSKTESRMSGSTGNEEEYDEMHRSGHRTTNLDDSERPPTTAEVFLPSTASETGAVEKRFESSEAAAAATRSPSTPVPSRSTVTVTEAAPAGAAAASRPTAAAAAFSFLWNHLKEMDLNEFCENFGDKNCAISECECYRTSFSVCAVLARTFLLKVVVRPLCKFLGRSKGRRRSRRIELPYLTGGRPCRMSPPFPIATILLVCSALIGIAEACSSRNTPKPRPPPPSARPNITFPTYTCPPTYAAWYCLNGATCFTIKIEESLLYNCECAEGFMGQRCEFKDLDGSYLPSRQRVLLETASIAGGATIAVFLVVIACVTLYLHYQRKSKEKRLAGVDRKDGPERDLERRAFNQCLSISMDRLPEFHNDRIMKSTSAMLGTRKTDHSPP